MSDRPIDLYIAAYSDPDAAKGDWDGAKQLARDGLIQVDALVLVRRDADGKIHVEDDFHTTGVGATVGVIGGAIIGLIFPPSLLASAVVGGAIGGGAGALVHHHLKTEIEHNVEDSLPPSSSGIVVLFEERFSTQVDDALGKADKVTKDEVDAESVKNAADAAKQS